MRWRPTLAPGLVLCVALLAGCATPREGTVVLLPQADGTPSAVVVQSSGGERRLDTPYARATARTGDREPPKLDNVAPADARSRYAPLFDSAPPPPRRFVLYFDSGNTKLTPESERLLPEVIQTAVSRSGAELVVIGHTDTKGSLAANDELALMRARLVVRRLVENRFPPEKIEAAGRGERELAVPTRDDFDEPRNRRVEIVVR
jgi:OmpA-OmpF porin, OOP family